jgi:hypothetical protein
MANPLSVLLGRALAGGAAVVCVLSLAGCGAPINEDTYAQITDGMTYEDVKRIMGSDGELQDGAGFSIGGGGVLGQGKGISADYKVRTWRDGNKEITVTFANGKMIMKNKAGF